MLKIFVKRQALVNNPETQIQGIGADTTILHKITWAYYMIKEKDGVVSKDRGRAVVNE